MRRKRMWSSKPYSINTGAILHSLGGFCGHLFHSIVGENVDDREKVDLMVVRLAQTLDQVLSFLFYITLTPDWELHRYPFPDLSDPRQQSFSLLGASFQHPGCLGDQNSVNYFPWEDQQHQIGRILHIAKESSS